LAALAGGGGVGAGSVRWARPGDGYPALYLAAGGLVAPFPLRVSKG